METASEMHQFVGPMWLMVDAIRRGPFGFFRLQGPQADAFRIVSMFFGTQFVVLMC
jgi:hypothetical protein